MKHSIHNKILSAFILLFSAAILFISLIVLTKYFLVTLSGLHEPVFKLVKMLLTEEKIKNGILFQTIVICKIFSLIISGGFIFIIYSTLSTVFSSIFYNICSRNYKKIRHPLKFSIIKGVKWNFYRTFLVISPPLLVKTTGSLLLFLSIVLFNLFLKIAGISISLTAFLISFIAFSLVFLFILSLLVSLWQFVSTVFGTEIAVSEPRLRYKTIEKRSKKLVLSKNYNIFLCISSFVIAYCIIFQIKYALTTNLLTNPANYHFLNLMIIVNLLCLMVFEYLKASGYINSLIEHSQKISKCPIKVVNS